VSKIELIESQIKELSPEELTRFRAWFAEFDGELWDRQIEKDAQGGKLDRLAETALREHRTGNSTKL
jgi:hypothetical protein